MVLKNIIQLQCLILLFKNKKRCAPIIVQDAKFYPSIGHDKVKHLYCEEVKWLVAYGLFGSLEREESREE